MAVRTTSTGFTERIDNVEDKFPEFDPRSGNHFWIMTGAWKCDPKAILANKEPALLDHENLLGVLGPGCWFCQKEYNPTEAMRRCTGPPND